MNFLCFLPSSSPSPPSLSLSSSLIVIIGGYTDNTVESMYATTTTKRAMKKGSTTKTPNNNNHNNKSSRKSLSAPDAASVVTMPSMLEGYEGNDDDDDSLESMLNDDDFRFTGKRKGATGLGADTAATNISFDNSLYNSNKRDSLLIQEQKKAHPGVATLSPTTNSKVSPQTDKESMESDYRGPSQQPKVNTVSMHEIDDQSVLTGNDTMEYIEDLLDTGLASATIQTSASYRKHLQSVLTEHDDDDNSSSPISYTAHSHTGHPHHHSSHSSKVNENALSCGKLILAEQNSAIKLEREKATKKVRNAPSNPNPNPMNCSMPQMPLEFLLLSLHSNMSGKKCVYIYIYYNIFHFMDIL